MESDALTIQSKNTFKNQRQKQKEKIDVTHETMAFVVNFLGNMVLFMIK